MANPEHLKILKQGVEAWNKWREENPDVRPDLSDTVIENLNLYKANLSRANCFNTHFNREMNLNGVDFRRAILDFSHMPSVLLIETDFRWASLNSADLRGTIIDKSRFEYASLVETDLSHAGMYECWIYGINVWAVKKENFEQKDLIVTPQWEPEITVDDLEVAQFIYLMLNNQKIRDVIEKITSKAVLILGNFRNPERKKVLDALKDELRQRNYLPIVFDFQNPGGKSLNETMSLLAGMSRFIVADITDARAVREELALVVPHNPSVPVVPLVLKGQEVYSTFDFPKSFKSVLPLHEYDSPEILLENIIPVIITPAERKVAELREK